MHSHGFQLGDQFVDVGDLDARLADGGLRNLEQLDARARVAAVVGGRPGIEGLRLRLHDVGEARVARLVEAKVGGVDRGKRSEEGGVGKEYVSTCRSGGSSYN